MIPGELRLNKTTIEIYRPEGVTSEVRWTLSPTWFDRYADSDELPSLPYYEPTPDQIGLPDAEIMPFVRTWAETALRETTNYLVSGWADDITPILSYRRHQLEIHTTDGTVTNFEVPGFIARRSIRSLVDPDDTIVFFAGAQDPGDVKITTETVIPVRHVTMIKHITETEPVKTTP